MLSMVITEYLNNTEGIMTDQTEFNFGKLCFATDVAREQWIRTVRRPPMSSRNNTDVWPLPKLMSDESMAELYGGDTYKDTVVAEKNIPIIMYKDKVL